MQRRRAGRDGSYLLAAAGEALQVLLEAADVRAQRHNPVVGERLVYIILFFAAHVAKAK